MRRFLAICAIAVILGLFFNAVEGHTTPEVEGEVTPEMCGLPPLNTSAVCCMTGDATAVACENIVAPGDEDICWCICEHGGPICGCGHPDDMLLEEQLFWGISRGRDTQQEVRI